MMNVLTMELSLVGPLYMSAGLLHLELLSLLAVFLIQIQTMATVYVILQTVIELTRLLTGTQQIQAMIANHIVIENVFHITASLLLNVTMETGSAGTDVHGTVRLKMGSVKQLMESSKLNVKRTRLLSPNKTNATVLTAMNHVPHVQRQTMTMLVLSA